MGRLLPRDLFLRFLSLGCISSKRDRLTTNVVTADPSLASIQDEHGYSLLHAGASWDRPELLRALKTEFSINPNLVDEDGETALFVAETVEIAKYLLEEIGVDPMIRNTEGENAEEKIRAEGDFVVVADYLKAARSVGLESHTNGSLNANEEAAEAVAERPAPLPPGIQLQVGSLEDEENLGEIEDPELKRRIDELASREDFQGEEAQRELRQLVTDALNGTVREQRDVRARGA